MHNSYALVSATSVKNVFGVNKFSGQLVGGLWVSGAQAATLSTGARAAKTAMWETPLLYTHQTQRLYTQLPTAIFGQITDTLLGLYPSSTGPIKKTTKFKKRIGVS